MRLRLISIALAFLVLLPGATFAQVQNLNQIASSTQAVPYWGVLMGDGVGGHKATASSSPTVNIITATSTTASSTLPKLSSTILGTGTICLTSDTCRTTWPAGTVYTATWPITLTGSAFGFNGLSTSTPAVVGNIPYFSGVNTFANVATSTLTPSSPLTGSFTQLGTGGSLGCQAASGSQAGCISSADWTTFNGKQAAGTYLTALGSGWATTTASAITFATTTQSFNGLTFAEKITVPSAGSVLFTPNVSGTLNNSGLTNSTITVNSTSIALGASGTITAASSSILADNNTWTGQNRFSFASTTLASLTNFYSGLTGVLIGNGANSLVTAGSAQTCTNQFFRALSATYSVTCASVTDSDFSGQLAVNHGGTGAATLTGLLQGNGTSAITGVTGTAGQFPYYNGTNTLLATSTIFLTSASAVGIGTLTPAAKLDVQGTSTASTGQIADFWKSDGTTVMRIRNDGSVGIGTTTPASTLEVSGIGSSITSTVYSGSGATGGNLNFRMARGTVASPTAVQTDDVLGGIFAAGYTSAGSFGSNVAAIRLQAAQNFTASNQGAYLSLFTTPLNSTARAEVLRISSAGNVGIGTTSPDTKLTVEGALTNFGQTVAVFRNTGTFNGGGLTLDAASTGNANLNFTSNMTPKATVGYNVTSNFLGFANFAYSSNDFSLRLNLDGSLAYNDGVSSAELFRINVNGRVGIGTTTPANKLTVAGDLGFYGTIPVLSACGTSPAIIVGSTDSAGEITEGAISTGCVITFAVAKTNAPFCTLSGKAGLVFTYAVSASAITITNVGALSSTNVVWHCIQNNK